MGTMINLIMKLFVKKNIATTQYNVALAITGAIRGTYIINEALDRLHLVENQ